MIIFIVSMIVVKFFSNFCPSAECIEIFTRTSELIKDPLFNTEYRFTIDDDYTHVIILNTAMPVLNIPKENVIGLACEPLIFLNLTNDFISYAEKYIGKYLIGEKRNLSEPFVEHFGYMWHITPPVNLPKKTKKMSLMVSFKSYARGHIYRHALCSNILKSNLPIDIYGNGCQYYNNIKDDRLKGKFDDKEPYQDYQFHIAIENVETPHYFSEKIMNTLLYNSIPVYLGCNNIDSYFPNSVIHLCGNIQTDMQTLHDICSNTEAYIKPIDMDHVKKTIYISTLIHKHLLHV